MRCHRCGAEIAANKRFCSQCGTPVALPSPPPPHVTVPSALVAPAIYPPSPRPAHSAVPPAPVAPPFHGEPLPQMAVRRVLSAEEAEFWAPPNWPSQLTSPPLPRMGEAFGLPSIPGRQSAAEGILLAAPAPWGFQEQTSALAADINRNLNSSGLVSRVVRAALLDGQVYREVAQDKTLQLETWLIALIAVSLVAVFWALLSFSIFGVMRTGPIVAGEIGAWLVRAWAIQVGARRLLNRPLDFDQIFRPMVYAQAVTLLQPLPWIGAIFGIWATVTSTAAIRDVTSVDTIRAILLNLLGGVAAALAGQFLTPLLVRIF